jgi:hypothetical protein
MCIVLYCIVVYCIVVKRGILQYMVGEGGYSVVLDGFVCLILSIYMRAGVCVIYICVCVCVCHMI